MLKITPQMGARWVKAAFVIIIGFVILLYVDKIVEDLRTLIEEGTNHSVVFTGTWDLLTILLWILVAWLFVYAVLTIVVSFSESKYNLSDVMKWLMAIEKKLGIPSVKEVQKFEEEPAEEPVTPGPLAEEEPPPP